MAGTTLAQMPGGFQPCGHIHPSAGLHGVEYFKVVEYILLKSIQIF
jgi:hypothetical protein